jgi:hypothetical protein
MASNNQKGVLHIIARVNNGGSTETLPSNNSDGKRPYGPNTTEYSLHPKEANRIRRRRKYGTTTEWPVHPKEENEDHTRHNSRSTQKKQIENDEEENMEPQ